MGGLVRMDHIPPQTPLYPKENLPTHAIGPRSTRTLRTLHNAPR